MFVGALKNMLRVGHLNESPALRLAASLAKVATQVECYNKCEELNFENKL